MYRNDWFVLSQTDGADFTPEQFGGWERAKAMTELGISETPFDLTNGNIHGFARKRSIGINPAALMTEATTFHEMAHGELFALALVVFVCSFIVLALHRQELPFLRNV